MLNRHLSHWDLKKITQHELNKMKWKWVYYQISSCDDMSLNMMCHVITRWDIALKCYLGKWQSPPRNQSPPGRVLLQMFEKVGQLLDSELYFNVRMIDSLWLFWEIFVAISWKLLWRQTTNIICANNKIQTFYLVTFETGFVYLHRSLTVLEFVL